MSKSTTEEFDLDDFDIDFDAEASEFEAEFDEDEESSEEFSSEDDTDLGEDELFDFDEDEALDTQVEDVVQANAALNVDELIESCSKLHADTQKFVSNLVAQLDKSVSKSLQDMVSRLEVVGNNIFNLTERVALLEKSTADSSPSPPSTNPKKDSKATQPSRSSKTEEQPSKESAVTGATVAKILKAAAQKDRSGSSAEAFAKLLSEKGFKGAVSPDAVMSVLEANKLVYKSGKKKGQFK